MPRSFNVIIRNGLVFNGTGEAPARLDVGIDGDTIRAVENLEDARGVTEVDASNRYVAPGFIDLTNHSDTHWTLFDQTRQESLITQGITTVIGGNCGSSLAPLAKASDIEGIRKWTDISRININWQTVDEFLSELNRMSLGVNIATLAGHGTLRRAAGMDITKPATSDDRAQLAYILREALEAGAFGFSTSLGRSHEMTTDMEELKALCAVAQSFDAVTTHHLADEGVGIISALSSIVGVLRETGARGNISHFKVVGRRAWPAGTAALELIERARADRVALTLDVFPYTRTGSNLYLLLPEWALEGGQEQMIVRLENAPTRTAIIDALRALTLHYDRIVIASTLHDVDAVGKTIARLAEESERTPEETVIELLRVNQLSVAIFNEAISESAMEASMRLPYAAISSDGVGQGTQGRPTDMPHPRSFGTFPRVFDIFVKQKKTLAWKDAIYKMTGLPASIVGIRDRGTLKNGMAADVVVFDPETIRDRADYEHPRELSAGVDWVFINGKAALSDGAPTGNLSGRALRRSS